MRTDIHACSGVKTFEPFRVSSATLHRAIVLGMQRNSSDTGRRSSSFLQSAFDESVAVIRYAADTSIAYFGSVGHLVVDELKHVVPGCSAAVLTVNGIRYGSLLHDEQQDIEASASSHEYSTNTSDFSLGGRIAVRSGHSVSASQGNDIHDVRFVYTHVVESHTRTLKFSLFLTSDDTLRNPDDGSLNDELLRSYLEAVTEVCIESERSSDASAMVEKAQQLQARFFQSPHLPVLLRQIVRRVNDILDYFIAPDDGHDRRNPFFIEFYVPRDDAPPRSSPYWLDVQQKHFQKFEESAKLGDSTETRYADYVASTKSSLYLMDVDEQHGSLSVNGKRIRDVRHLETQSLRGRFAWLVPLFCEGAFFAVMRINSPRLDAINISSGSESRKRNLRVARRIREIGVAVKDFVELDELVGRLEMDLQQRFLKEHLHSDLGYSHELDYFIGTVKQLSTDRAESLGDEVASDLRRHCTALSFYVEDRRLKIQELKAGNKMLEYLPRDMMFPALSDPSKRWVVKSEWLTDRFDDLVWVLSRKKHSVAMNLHLSDSLQQLSGIPHINDLILFRVIRNILQNSVNAAEKHHATRSDDFQVKVSLDVQLANDDRVPYLTIVGVDDCGGLDATEDIPLYPKPLTLEWWLRYVSLSDKPIRVTNYGFKGYGLLQFIKFAGKEGTVFFNKTQSPAGRGCEIWISTPLDSWRPEIVGEGLQLD